MPIADASATRLAFIKEATPGTTPATPAFANVRYTGESLSIQTDTVTSNEVRPDRNVSDMNRVASSASGSFDFELSYGSFDPFIQSLMASTFTTNVIKNGVLVPDSFTFEKTFEQGTTDSFHRLVGMVASGLSLKCEAGSLITGSFEFMGFGGSAANAIITGATYAAANTEPVMNATSDFANLTTTGIATTPRIMSLDFKANPNVRLQRAVGSLNAIGEGVGRFEVTGSMRAYFEDNNLFNAYLNSTAFALSFTLGSVTAKKYTISMPVVKISKATVVAGGNNQDVMVDLEFRALFDAASAATLTITRAVA